MHCPGRFWISFTPSLSEGTISSLGEVALAIIFTFGHRHKLPNCRLMENKCMFISLTRMKFYRDKTTDPLFS